MSNFGFIKYAIVLENKTISCFQWGQAGTLLRFDRVYKESPKTCSTCFCVHCRMENSETSPPPRPVAVPDRAMLRPSGPLGQMSESPRACKHKERPSKSPRKRRDGKRSQRREGDHEQLLWEIERRRLPGQHEHSEPCGSASDAAESSPKRFALQGASWSYVPLAQVCCLGHEVMLS